MKEYPKDNKWFKGSRILLRRLVNRKQRLMAGLVKEDFVTNKNLYSILPKLRDEAGSLFLAAFLGVLNSRLVSKLYLSQVTQATKDDFPQVTIADIMALPLPVMNEKTQHDLSQLTEKVSELKKRLASAKNDSEQAVLNNAIESAEQKVEVLICGLYKLTPQEKTLVDGDK